MDSPDGVTRRQTPVFQSLKRTDNPISANPLSADRGLECPGIVRGGCCEGFAGSAHPGTATRVRPPRQGGAGRGSGDGGPVGTVGLCMFALMAAILVQRRRADHGPSGLWPLAPGRGGRRPQTNCWLQKAAPAPCTMPAEGEMA
ncbi:hypothetical protein ACOMHN_000134 [Nucella lapillus]